MRTARLLFRTEFVKYCHRATSMHLWSTPTACSFTSPCIWPPPPSSLPSRHRTHTLRAHTSARTHTHTCVLWNAASAAYQQQSSARKFTSWTYAFAQNQAMQLNQDALPVW